MFEITKRQKRARLIRKQIMDKRLTSLPEVLSLHLFSRGVIFIAEQVNPIADERENLDEARDKFLMLLRSDPVELQQHINFLCDEAKNNSDFADELDGFLGLNTDTEDKERREFRNRAIPYLVIGISFAGLCLGAYKIFGD